MVKGRFKFGAVGVYPGYSGPDPDDAVGGYAVPYYHVDDDPCAGPYVYPDDDYPEPDPYGYAPSLPDPYYLRNRIDAMDAALERYRLGNAPTEDEEVSDFAVYFAEEFAHPHLMPKIQSRLCSSCRDVPVLWLLESPRHGYTLFDNFERESGESCDLCKLIHRPIGGGGAKRINIGIAPQFLMIEAVKRGGGVDHGFLKLCADPEAASMGVEKGLPILPEAGGELHIILLREWLRDCNESHSDHGIASAKDNKLPTRVLDVGDAESPNRLLLYNTEGKQGKYIALSHCWGKANPLSTMKKNIDAHRNAINFNDLPKTFQDAVVITRGLNVQFLWIDSLCIIQDDAADWRRESANMEGVFASAYCTIAATSAKDSNEGFLNPRPDEQPVRLVDASAGTSFSVYASEVGGTFNHDVENGVLNRRGWVLQERALSPRTIHFTTTQTYWECGSVIRCENLIQMAKPSNLLSSSRFPMTTSGPPSGGAASAFENIFASYSERALTYQKDRPYAIAGLERRLMDLYKTGSSHGIVHCCLGKSLLWQRSGTERLKKISDYGVEVVPSWSWMKYEGKIRYGSISKVNTSWNRDIKLIPPGLSGQEQCALEAPGRKILQRCHIEPQLDTICKINDAEGHLVGCIRFDHKDQVDVGCLRFIIIAWHKFKSWTELGKDTWKDFVDISWGGELEWHNLCYVLVVSHVAFEQGYEIEEYHRLGVGVIQGGCLSFGGQPRILRVV